VAGVAGSGDIDGLIRLLSAAKFLSSRRSSRGRPGGIMATLISFGEALAHARGGKKPVMLGNDFGIACQPRICSSTSVFDSAAFGAITNAKNAFTSLGATDLAPHCPPHAGCRLE
jgi:hypothetical protein